MLALEGSPNPPENADRSGSEVGSGRGQTKRTDPADIEYERRLKKSGRIDPTGQPVGGSGGPVRFQPLQYPARELIIDRLSACAVEANLNSNLFCQITKRFLAQWRIFATVEIVTVVIMQTETRHPSSCVSFKIYNRTILDDTLERLSKRPKILQNPSVKTT